MVEIHFFQEFPEIFRDHVAGMIREFELMLPMWVQVVDVRLDRSDDNLASMGVDKDYRRMCLHVSTDLFSEDIRVQRECVLHEIAHCYNAQIGDVAFELLNMLVPDAAAAATDEKLKQLYYVLERRIKEAVEGSNTDLTYAILRYTESLDRAADPTIVEAGEQ